MLAFLTGVRSEDMDTIVQQFDGRITIQIFASGIIGVSCDDLDTEAVEFIRNLADSLGAKLVDGQTRLKPLYIPSDTFKEYQLHHYGHNESPKPFAYGTYKGFTSSDDGVLVNSRPVKIAVIDTGIAYHPDLNPNRLITSINTGQSTAVHCVGVAVKIINNQVVYETISANSTSQADIDAALADTRNWHCAPGKWSTHGTHVAGLIGAKGNNNLGVSGMFWGVEDQTVSGVFNFRVADGWYKDPVSGEEGPMITFAQMVGAMDLCILNGFDVVNISLGAEIYTWAGAEALYEFLVELMTGKANGIVVDPRPAKVTWVLAAGNYNAPTAGIRQLGPYIFLPAHCRGENIITVGSSNLTDGEKTYYSNYHRTHVAINGYGGDGWFPYYNALLSTSCTPPGPEYEGMPAEYIKEDGGYNYVYMPGTSMAAPCIAGMIAVYLNKANVNRDNMPYVIRQGNQEDWVDISSYISGCTGRHTRGTFWQTLGGGAVYHHQLINAAKNQSGSTPLVPPRKVEAERVVNSSGDEVIQIKIWRYASSTPLFGITVSCNRFTSPYEYEIDDRDDIVHSEAFLLTSTTSPYVVEIRLEDIYQAVPDAVALGIYVCGYTLFPSRVSVAKKLRFPLIGICPEIQYPLTQYVEVINTDLSSYFQEVPSITEFQSAMDLVSLRRLYRMAHIVLSRAHGMSFPPAGGIFSYPPYDLGDFPEDWYTPRENLTVEEIEYALKSLHVQLQEFVDGGVYRYSSSLGRHLYYYPIDMYEYFASGKLRRRRLPDAWKKTPSETQRFSRTLVFQIIEMLKYLTCLMGVKVGTQVKDCGASMYTCNANTLETGTFTKTIPLGAPIEMAGNPTIKIDDAEKPGWYYQGNLLHNDQGDVVAHDVVSGSPFFPVSSTVYPYVSETGAYMSGLSDDNFEFVSGTYHYVPAGANERNDAVNKTESLASSPYTSPGLLGWVVGNVNGASYGDRSSPIIGSPLRPNNIRMYTNENSTSGRRLVGGIGDPGQVAWAEVYRGCVYKTYTAIRIYDALVVPDLYPPVRIKFFITNHMGTHVSSSAGFPGACYPNNTYHFPCRQTGRASGYIKIYAGDPGSTVIYTKQFNHSLQIPVNDSGVDYIPLDDAIVEIPENPGYIVVETGMDLETVKANPLFTLMVHYTPNPLPDNPQQLIDTAEGEHGNFHQVVYSGTFSNSVFDMHTNLNPEQPVSVYWLGYASYTRECGIGVIGVPGIDAQDYVRVPDLRGMPSNDAKNLCNALGITKPSTPNAFSTAGMRFTTKVFTVPGDEDEWGLYIVDQAPRPSTVVKNANTSGGGVPVQVFCQQEWPTTTGEVSWIPTDITNKDYRITTVSIPYHDPVAYTIPGGKYHKSTRSTTRYWENTEAYVSVPYDAKIVGYIPTNEQMMHNMMIQFPKLSDIYYSTHIVHPDTGLIVPLNPVSMMYLYTPSALTEITPSLVGLTWDKAKALCDALNIDLVVSGGRLWRKWGLEDTPVVVRQFPEPGESLPWFFIYIRKVYVLLSIPYVDARCGWMLS